MSQSNLEILIEALDHFSKPAKQIAEMSEKVVKKMQEMQKALGSLKGQQEALNGYQKLAEQLRKTAQQFEQARQKTAILGRQLKQAKQPTEQLKSAFEQARRASGRLENQHHQQKQVLQHLSQQFKKCGIDTKNFAQAQENLQQKTQKTIERMEAFKEKAHQITSKSHQKLQNAANLFTVGAGVQNFGRQTWGMLASPFSQMRSTERAKGELATLGMDSAGIELIGKKGEEMSKKLAYLSKSDFLKASYGIKSGIASLDDQGVAEMTALAATTARATKGNVGQMTRLFAAGHGTFKESLYEGLSDQEFGGVFSAAFSKSVQQFKTDGAKMQQAIESMGSGMAAAGVSMTDQFTALGMLQQKNDAGTAGALMKSLGASAFGAQARFEKMGLNIETFDGQGNLKSLPQILEQMQAELGEEFTKETGAKIKAAFDSQEAVSFFESLWGQQEAFRKNAQALKEATKQGGAFAETLANQRDTNMDARMEKLKQRWDLVLEKIGVALVPALERLIPWLEKGAEWLGQFIEGNKGWVTAIVGGVGLLAGVVAPVSIAFGVLRNALISFGNALKKTSLRSDGMEGTASAGKKKRSFKGALTQGGKFLGSKLGGFGAALGAVSLGSTLFDDALSKTEKIKHASGKGGGLAGGLAGAFAGAAMGSVIPIIGTSLGGLVGGALGAWGGGALGKSLANRFAEPKEKIDKLKIDPAKTSAASEKLLLSSQIKQGAFATLTSPNQAVRQLQKASQATQVQIEKIELNLGGLQVTESGGHIDTQALIGQLEPQLRQVIERTFQDIQRTQANLSFEDQT